MNKHVEVLIKIVKENHFPFIYLNDLELKKFPSELYDLPWLTEIELNNNRISDLSKQISILQDLEKIELNNNGLKKIPKELFFLPKLKRISFLNNPLTEPPIEIVNQGIEACRNYFLQSENENTLIYEAKLLVVGEGYVGKSTLVERLINNHFNNELDSTQGISIKALSLNVGDIPDFRINIWDFGGQEIYHATHQFFLTKRSLYLLIWDPVKEDKYHTFEYWLNIIKLLSDSSPVIVVQNKIDQRIRSIDEKSLHDRFPNIVGFHEVSAKNGKGIDELVERIKQEIFKLDHIGDSIPKVWVDIKEELFSLQQNYIDLEKYLMICSKDGLSEKSSLFLSQYFHDLGVFLHFQDNFILRDFLFVKPEWATNAVYSLTDSDQVIENKGKFSIEELSLIWQHYPHNKYMYLLELMKKFELCFELEDHTHYIIPELLPESIESLNWDFQDNLIFEYHYAFMPKAVMTRLIVLNHLLIEDDIFWRNGVILKYDSSLALIKSDLYDKKIKIYINGSNKAELLAIIRNSVRHIHETLNFPEAKEMVSCSCDECIKSTEPQMHDYSTLRKYLVKGEESIMCNKSISSVQISKLLGYIKMDNGSIANRLDEIYLMLNNLYDRNPDKESIKTRLNSYLTLQPNAFGFGINFNKLIDDFYIKKRKPN